MLLARFPEPRMPQPLHLTPTVETLALASWLEPSQDFVARPIPGKLCTKLIPAHLPSPFSPLPPLPRLPVGGAKGWQEQSLKISLRPPVGRSPSLDHSSAGLAAQTLPEPHSGADAVTTDSSTSPRGSLWEKLE